MELFPNFGVHNTEKRQDTLPFLVPFIIYLHTLT